jgi:hypothetical protein
MAGCGVQPVAAVCRFKVTCVTVMACSGLKVAAVHGALIEPGSTAVMNKRGALLSGTSPLMITEGEVTDVVAAKVGAVCVAVNTLALARRTSLGAPWGPVAPVAPAGPWGPAGPMGPDAPEGPTGPCGPVAPVAPGSPCGPIGPCGPIAPVAPWAPAGPISETPTVGHAPFCFGPNRVLLTVLR